MNKVEPEKRAVDFNGNCDNEKSESIVDCIYGYCLDIETKNCVSLN